MTASPSKRPLPHAWVLYVAGLAPAIAIAFAFSLGPSARKRMHDLDEATPAEARAILRNLDAGELGAVLEAAAKKGPHQALLLTHLGQRGHAPAAELLTRLSASPAAPEAVRSAARASLERLEKSAPSGTHAASGPEPLPRDRS